MSASSDRDLRSPIVTTARRRSPAKKGIKRPTLLGKGCKAKELGEAMKENTLLKKK